MENVQIGKLYKRRMYSSWKKNLEREIVVVTGMTECWSNIKFYYIDNPDEECEWNNAAFMDGFEEC